MKDIVGQEIVVGDIISVAHNSLYLRHKKQHIAIVTKINPNSIKVYIRINESIAYKPGAIELFDIVDTKEKVIKLQFNEHNQKLFLQGLHLSSKQTIEITELFKLNKQN